MIESYNARISVAECFANLECKVADTSLVKRYNLLAFEVLKAWRDPAQKNPKTIPFREPERGSKLPAGGAIRRSCSFNLPALRW